MYDKFTLVGLPPSVVIASIGLGFVAVVAVFINVGIEAAQLRLLGL